MFHTNDWHYVELEFVGHSNNGRATLYLDGVQVLEFKGNTQAQSAYGANSIALRGNNGSYVLFDDLYVIDEATRLGERRIETLRPNGDIAGNDFIPNTGDTGFGVLDDPTVSAADFVSASTQGNRALYNFTNLSTVPDKIDAIQLNVWAAKTDSATRQISTLVKSGAVETAGSDTNLPSSHLNVYRIENKNPANNGAWTPGAVNAIQAGLKITK
jgi:hypothetical protein